MVTAVKGSSPGRPVLRAFICRGCQQVGRRPFTVRTRPLCLTKSTCSRNPMSEAHPMWRHSASAAGSIILLFCQQGQTISKNTEWKRREIPPSTTGFMNQKKGTAWSQKTGSTQNEGGVTPVLRKRPVAHVRVLPRSTRLMDDLTLAFAVCCLLCARSCSVHLPVGCALSLGRSFRSLFRCFVCVLIRGVDM